MIDIENKIIDSLASAYESAGVDVTVTSEDLMSNSEFPCVSIEETLNSTYRRTLDEAKHEHHVRVEYHIYFYDNSKSRKKIVKNLFAIADDMMQELNFTRGSFILQPDYDYSVARGIARYSAIVQEGVTEGDTTTYKIYRN